jgi:DNA primase
VDETKGLFHCFGCDAKGDIIELVRKMEGISFRDALKKLEGVATDRPTTSQVVGRKADKERIPRIKEWSRKQTKDEETSIHSIVTPDTEGASPSTLITLNDVAEYYRKRLYDSKAAVQYLANRGITNTGLYERFKIGFSDGSILSKLSDSQKEELVKIGVLHERKNGAYHEHFHNCIVFPIFNQAEKVVGIYGRKITDDDPHHLYLSGPHLSIWNRKASKV